MKAPAAVAWCALAAAAVLAGCNTVPQSQYDQCLAQVNPLKDQVRKLTDENEGLRADVVAKRREIDSLTGLGNKRLALIPHASAIELGGFTGGYNTDATSKTPNAIKVYLLPKDAEGSVIKAVGALQVRLFDLQAPEGKNVLAECNYTPEQMAKNWYSGFLSMTYHYSFVCPWKRPPSGQEVLVRVEFVDYVTGKHLTAVKTVNVNVPPPASAK